MLKNRETTEEIAVPEDTEILQDFIFPEHSINVRARDLEEATEKLKELLSKK